MRFGRNNLRVDPLILGVTLFALALAGLTLTGPLGAGNSPVVIELKETKPIHP